MTRPTWAAAAVLLASLGAGCAEPPKEPSGVLTMIDPHSWHAGASVDVSKVNFVPSPLLPEADRETTSCSVTGTGATLSVSREITPIACFSSGARNFDPSHRNT